MSDPEYVVSKECDNIDAWYVCLKCGECGRVFQDGIMIDDGGTHPDDFA